METLVLEGLYKIFKEADIESVALRDARSSVQRGELVVITGRSGAGKPRCCISSAGLPR